MSNEILEKIKFDLGIIRMNLDDCLKSDDQKIKEEECITRFKKDLPYIKNDEIVKRVL